MSVEAKKLIDLTHLSRFKELLDQSVDGTAKFVKNSSLSISGDLGNFLLKADAEKKYISTATSEDGSTVVITIDNVGHATKVDQDMYLLIRIISI